MCATAIRWADIGRIVFGLSQSRFRDMDNKGQPKEPNDFTCREMFGRAGHAVEIVGPVLEDEAQAVHAAFWRT